MPTLKRLRIRTVKGVTTVSPQYHAARGGLYTLGEFTATTPAELRASIASWNFLEKPATQKEAK